MIDMLLRPIDETHNEHKRKQLRELALINGTLKDEDVSVCGGGMGATEGAGPYHRHAQGRGCECVWGGDGGN